jgi:hypothetical protein
LRFDLAHEQREILEVVAGRRIQNHLERSGISIVDHDVVGTQDDLELQALRQVGRRQLAVGGQVQLQNIGLRENRGKNQEKHQDHHHVDHRHDVQIITPLVVAGVITADEARSF